MKILGISGSLRQASTNTALLRAAMELAPASVTIEEHSIAEIPLYNDDVRAQGFPPSVVAFRSAIASADALLIATPEYNYSIPGVLKNAIDWASRAPDQPFAGKPLAMMSASIGMLGGARAQYHLRQVAVYLDVIPLNKPEVFVARADEEKFDQSLKLTDEATRNSLRALIEALVAHHARLSGAGRHA